MAIDASIWFDDKLFLKDPEFTLKEKDFSGKKLCIGIANTSTYGSTQELIKTDTLSVNRHVGYS